MGTGPPLGVERKHLSYFWMNACMAVGLGAKHSSCTLGAPKLAVTAP